MPVLTAVQRNAWIRAYYQRLLARGKLPKVAVIAAMRKLLVAVYTVAKTRRPFVPHLIPQETRERADAEIGMAGDRDVMLAVLGSGQANMTAALTGHPVAQVSEGLGEIVSGDVPRQPHAVMTSSRTK
jgi:hypothetical protein